MQKITYILTTVVMLLSFSVGCRAAEHKPKDASAVEREVLVGATDTAAYMPLLRDKRVTVLANHTAMFSNEEHIVDMMHREGINIVGAHIDSPRIDIKQNPLYENEGQAYLDTHYYGGIKKYQWPTIELALHGVIYRKDGSVIINYLGAYELPFGNVATVNSAYKYNGTVPISDYKAYTDNIVNNFKDTDEIKKLSEMLNGTGEKSKLQHPYIKTTQSRCLTKPTLQPTAAGNTTRSLMGI